MMQFNNDTDEEFITDEGGENESFEDVDATEGNVLLRIKELKETLKKCERERKEYLDGWQRAKADYLNSNKRFAEERSQITARTEQELLERLLPLCDSFDMALKAAEDGEGGLHEGIKRIHGQLFSFLQGLGVSPVDETGVPFDPYIHEALQNEKVSEEAKHDTVVALLQKGYRRGDVLIRPAKVTVGVFEK